MNDSRPFPPIIENIKEWPIYKFSEDREQFISKLTDHVLSKMVSTGKLEESLRKTTYQEQQRVRTNPWKVDPSDEKEYWTSISKEIENTSSAANPELEKLKILKRIVNRYGEEIIGHFVPTTHNFARKVLSTFFKRLYNNGWGINHKWIWGSRKELLTKIKVRGHIDTIRKLFNKGTVVVVPTHYSNLDSILIAYAIDMKAGLPAFSYGAGLNLYDLELLAYYMNRLGAYRVDRRKKNPVYLETLKSMASLSLEDGLNHIFFPGGTRSRSGAIEEKLKLGLLNSVIDAQRNGFLEKKSQKIYIVPLALGYHFVLEAESLIDQHLRKIGREKYSRSKKKGSILRTIGSYFLSLRRHDSEVFMSFGEPMDVLGNLVDEEGNSIDDRGKPIDLSTYFSLDDVLNTDTQRESIYTKILAEKIVESFKRNNIILPSHLVAYVLFDTIANKHSELDLFEILKLPTKTTLIPFSEIESQFKVKMKHLRHLQSEGLAKFSEEFEISDSKELLLSGASKVGVYHSKKVVKIRNNDQFGTEDLKLLFFYYNKMVHYNFPDGRVGLV